MVRFLIKERRRCHDKCCQIHFESFGSLSKRKLSSLISSAKRSIRMRMKGAITMSVQAVEGKKKVSVKDLTTTSMMIAIILLMAFTPLGYLQTGGASISLLTVPVAIGAMIIGPKAGLLLGTIFGLTSFYQCFGISPFGTTLLGINPLFTFLLCVPTRALVGWFSGLIFIGLAKVDKTKTACYFIGGLITALLNTILYMSVFILFFWNTEFVQSINAGLGDLNVFFFVIAFVGVNAVLEMTAACLIGGTVAKTLKKILYKKVRSN